MLQSCKNCQQNFEITEDDLEFYERISPIFPTTTTTTEGLSPQLPAHLFKIPPPTICPDCRQQRRLAFRNERNLYHRKCDFSGKQIISMYSEDKNYKVYSQDIWWSDKFDAIEYGLAFNFNKNFFEQFYELNNKVPKLTLINKNCFNSDYSLFSSDLKNCYLVFSALKSEDCYYGYQCNWSKNCVDISFCYECELCYETIDSKNCYNCKFIQNCDSSDNLSFCYGCKGCSNCFLSVNLANRTYCIQNIQYSKEEYFRKVSEINLNRNNTEQIAEIFENLKIKFPKKFASLFNCEDCTGDCLRDCKNCEYCFDLPKSENSKYVWTGIGVQNCMDCCYSGRQAEFCYECLSAFPAYNEIFSIYSWESNNLFYCDYCFNCSNCFGCVGLKHKEYCILNKQYSKKEYERLVTKIIKHMQKMGEWGEFFPISVSPFSYNETVAQEYFPLTKEECLAKGYKWKDEDESSQYQGPIYEVPENITNVKDDICNAILECETTGKLYKIIPQELKFYREMNLPIPRECPDQRHKDRMALRNPRILFDRKCMKCNAEIKTTYEPSRPEIVYCEKCYLEEVY